ncbi:hypothetical protein [Crateriforma spongiae]|uniref:hypothetical protein n=1 Tax=Crateriforma spongiae TaxID=2724528 RepID=UPI0014470F32|nr:hypothetical protein [Crateriforma spongiae]
MKTHVYCTPGQIAWQRIAVANQRSIAAMTTKRRSPMGSDRGVVANLAVGRLIRAD